MLENEIRIGNCVEYKNEIHSIKSIYANSENVYCAELHEKNDLTGYTVKLSDLKAINLNDEILTKLGFQKEANAMFINDFAYKIQIDADAYHSDTVLYEGIGGHCYEKTGKLFLSVLRAGNYVGKSVEFLHEFQNHWFALRNLEYDCRAVLNSL